MNASQTAPLGSAPELSERAAAPAEVKPESAEKAAEPAQPEAAKSEPAAAEPAPKPAAPKPAPKPAKKPAPAPKPAAPAAVAAAPAAPVQAAISPSATPSMSAAAEAARMLRKKRAQRLVLKMLFWVGLPTLVAAVYFGGLAKNQYESVTTFLVRGGHGEDTRRDAMVQEYLLSRDMLQTLDAGKSWSRHYENAGDTLSRLDPSAGSESRYDFFRGHVDVSYDAHTHVFNLRVRAFSGREAQLVASEMLQAANQFVTATEGEAKPLLITLAKPSAPNESTRPKRGYGILTVFCASLALFGIGSLMLAAVREHAHF